MNNFYQTQIKLLSCLQSGLSSCAKHGGPVFSAVSGSIKDLATVPGSCNHLGPPNLMTFAPAFVFLSVLNVYSFAIEFWGCICYFRSKWISRAKFFTFPGDGRPRRGWIACNMQWLFLLFWMKNLLQTEYYQDSPPQDCPPRGQFWGGECWYPGISRLPTPIMCCFLCS